MELRDLIVTPILLMVIYLVAYRLRPFVTNSVTRRYFVPALTVRIVGAIALGLVYQFYYDGGDTFNFHTHGSRHMWEAFWNAPGNPWKMFLYGSSDITGVYSYVSKIYFINDPTSFAVIRVAFLFDLLTFSSYCGTAVLFAVVSFAGMWAFFLTFYRRFPHLHKWIAIAAFFIPSVFFWGSGVMKDTLTLAALGGSVFLVDKIFIQGKLRVRYLFGLAFLLYALYVIKIYILLVFIPAVVIWVFLTYLQSFRSIGIRIILTPIVAAAAILFGYLAVNQAVMDNEKYALENVAETAKVTAYDIRYWTGKGAGSGYELGELDGSMSSLVRLAPQAINVSLFRPYLWEVKNPMMLLAAIESTIILVLVMYFVFFRIHRLVIQQFPWADFAFIGLFALVFAFAVGVSTFNFGTLVRYKIPLLPFLGMALVLMLGYSRRDKKLDEFASTE